MLDDTHRTCCVTGGRSNRNEFRGVSTLLGRYCFAAYKLCQVVTLNVVKSIKFLRCSNMILFFILKGIEFWLMSSMRACMKTKGVLFINVDSAIFMSYCVLFDFFFCTMIQSVNAFRSDAVNHGVCASISCVCVCVWLTQQISPKSMFGRSIIECLPMGYRYRTQAYAQSHLMCIIAHTQHE